MKTKPAEAATIHAAVERHYDAVARGWTGGCGATGEGDPARVEEVSRRAGYEPADLDAVPAGANLGLGCGNPTALEMVSPGEVVLDVGCGAGMDVFLAARRVGPAGHVIGVDMTGSMLELARANAARSGLHNVDFRQGRIEALPVESETVDAVISNCVINLAPDKAQVYREIHRVLRPGGRAMVSDVVLKAPLPPPVRLALEAWVDCVAGAELLDTCLATIRAAGFDEVTVVEERSFAVAVSLDDPRVRQAMDQFGITPQMAAHVLASVASVGLVARKGPRRRP